MIQKSCKNYRIRVFGGIVILFLAQYSFVFAQLAQSIGVSSVTVEECTENHAVPSPHSGIFAPSATSNLIARATGNVGFYKAEIAPYYATDANFPMVDSVNESTMLPPVNDGISQSPEISQRYSPVSTQYVHWFDAARNRSVPVKIYHPAYATEKCPVIVFSHGLGGSHEKCDYLGQTWAAQGFVSVHIRHVGIDEDVWKRKIRPIKELKDVYGQHWSGRTQALDIRFVLNQLEWLATSDSRFGQMIDMTRIGVAGYDLGGLASMLVAGQLPPDRGAHLHDPRVKAIVVMSPPVYDHVAYAPVSYGTMSVPALFFTGTEDDGWVGTTKAWQRRIPFDHMQGNDRFLVTYQGADHMIYGGHIRSSKSRDDRKYQANTARASLLFWRAYLREEPAVQAYFRGPSLGTVAGSLGRVERRLADNVSMANVSAANVATDVMTGDVIASHVEFVDSHRQTTNDKEPEPSFFEPSFLEPSFDETSNSIIFNMH